MNLEDQVCSLELSKRLKELGVNKSSIFVWEYINEKCYGIKFIPYAVVPDSNNVVKLFSAFTCAELGEMLPYYNYEIIKSIRWIEFGCEFFKISFKDITEANARAKMLIYLIENGFMKKDEVATDQIELMKND